MSSRNSSADRIAVISPGNECLWTQAEQVEAGIFIEKGYVESPEELSLEYAPYSKASRFIVASRVTSVDGVMRVISHSEAGFKTINDIESGRLVADETGLELMCSIDDSKAFEVGTMGVNKLLRSASPARLAVALYGAIYRLTEDEEINTVIASFDERFFRLFSLMFGPSVIAMGPSTDYMGSPTIPAHIDTSLLMNHTKENHPANYTTMVDAATKVTYY